MSISMPIPVPEKYINKKMDYLERKGLIIPFWIGSGIIANMFLLYLAKKYKSPCSVNKNVNELNISTNPDSKYNSHNYINNMTETIADCIEKNPKMFTMLVTLVINIRGKESLHANLLIYRSKDRTFELFEPNGELMYEMHKDQMNIINERLNYFMNVLNNVLEKRHVEKIIFKPNKDVCPYFFGFQSLEALYGSQKYDIEGPGYCLVWSLFFAELMLKNPDIPSDVLFSTVYKKINRPGGGLYLKNMIRGYTNIIYEKLEKYFKLVTDKTLTIPELNNIIINNVNENSMFEKIIYLFYLEYNDINTVSKINEERERLQQQYNTPGSNKELIIIYQGILNRLNELTPSALTTTFSSEIIHKRKRSDSFVKTNKRARINTTPSFKVSRKRKRSDSFVKTNKKSRINTTPSSKISHKRKRSNSSTKTNKKSRTITKKNNTYSTNAMSLGTN
jgi:hypothetical protein